MRISLSMRKNAESVDADTPIASVAARMLELDIVAMPVVEGRRLADLLRET